MIEVLDQQVGEILDKLDELGLTQNTLVMFTSDNGPHLEGGADPDYFDSNGIYKGYKRDLYEGGIRVPMLARWPNKIKAKSNNNHISAFWDVLPTLLEISGQTLPKRLDGISFLPSMLGQDKQEQHDYLYWEFHEKGGRMALRQGVWKLVQYNVNKDQAGELELYNLEKDPSEEINVATQFPDITDRLNKLMRSARTESEIFQFAKK